MPKAKWTDDSDLTADEIDNAEDSGGAYAGPCPPSGVYELVLKRMRKGTSKSGNAKLEMIWEVTKDGGKKDQSKYAGAPLFDHMPVSAASAFRAKALCSGLGVSSKDFMNNMVVDEEGNVLKIGSLKIELSKTTVFANVKRENDPDNGERIVTNGGSYLPKADGTEGKTAVKAKGGKGKTKSDSGESESGDGEEDPF